jgi:hypothetical protein
MSIRDCKECLTLWQAYLKAATACINLRMQQGVAAANEDVTGFKRLDAQLDAAEEASRRAKRRAAEHQRTEHPDEHPPADSA